MSSAAASTRLARTREWSRVVGRELDALVLCTSAVGLMTMPFVARATSTGYEFPLNRSAVVAFLALVQLLPVLLLSVLDFRLRSWVPAWHLRFRAVLLGFPWAFLLLHELGSMIDGGAYVRDPGSISAFIALGAPLLWGLPRLALRYMPAVATFNRFVLPATLVPTLLLLGNEEPGDVQPNLSLSKASEGGTASLPTAFILVFDELAYSSLLTADESIDAEKYPNLTEFARDAAVFPDASAQWFLSVEAVPNLVSTSARLAGDTDVNLYIQYSAAEAPFATDCGVRYRCIGADSFAGAQPATVFGQVLLSYTWHLTPGPLRDIVRLPREWLGERLGQPQSVSDPKGFQLLTEYTLRAFADGASVAGSTGEVHVLHSMLSHFPYFYDRNGGVHGGANLDYWTPGVDDAATYANHRRHLEYTDERFGELIGVLRENGRYEDSIIILTADHGLRRGDVLGDEAPATLPLEIASVPLMIHGPGIEPGEYDAPYSHQDFEATLRDLLGLEPPATGRSAFAPRPAVEDAREFTVHSWTAEEDWHYERAPGEDVWRLVRIDEDPPER